MGTWHEVARLPLAFEKKCVASSFYYRMKAPDETGIYNLCWYKCMNGPMRRAKATAYLRDLDDPAHMIIQFTGPFTGPYTVIYVDDSYKTALVGAPDRRHLWILSRTFVPEPNTLSKLIKEAKSNGYDISRLIYTKEFYSNSTGSRPLERTTRLQGTLGIS
jgi:apolipoprotein D and lipocalin family protein